MGSLLFKVRQGNSDMRAIRTKSRIIQFRSVLNDSEQKRSTPVCKLIILLHVDDNSCCRSRNITSKKHSFSYITREKSTKNLFCILLKRR